MVRSDPRPRFRQESPGTCERELEQLRYSRSDEGDVNRGFRGEHLVLDTENPISDSRSLRNSIPPFTSPLPKSQAISIASVLHLTTQRESLTNAANSEFEGLMVRILPT